MKLLISYVILFATSLSFAGLSEDLETIKKLGHDMEPDGAICEEVAKLRFQEQYPMPDYSVVNGIEYSEPKGLTIGELDIVVFNNKTHLAEVIAEVKCWKSAKGGLKKAKEQRQRFQLNIKSNKNLRFVWLDDSSLKLSKSQFTSVQNFLFVGQQGTQAEGFDFELAYTLSELAHMRSEILNCQAQNTCPRPR